MRLKTISLNEISSEWCPQRGPRAEPLVRGSGVKMLGDVFPCPPYNRRPWSSCRPNVIDEQTRQLHDLFALQDKKA